MSQVFDSSEISNLELLPEANRVIAAVAFFIKSIHSIDCTRLVIPFTKKTLSKNEIIELKMKFKNLINYKHEENSSSFLNSIISIATYSHTRRTKYICNNYETYMRQRLIRYHGRQLFNLNGSRNHRDL